MKLYKYRELKDGSDEAIMHIQSILQQQAFWCAKPDTLNDDQEFSWRCNYQSTTETVGLLAALISRKRNRPLAETKEQVEHFVASSSLENVAAPVIAGLIQQCRSEVGLLCFGTSPNNPTLWSRYGSNGEGVCIELDVPDLLLNTQLFEVQYAHEKVVHIDDLLRAYFTNTTKMYSLALLTKPAKWAPEEEVRFVSSKQGVSVRIEGAQVSGLYLGRSLSASTEDRVRNIVKALSYEAMLHKQPSA
jgi:hypothetical protein